MSFFKASAIRLIRVAVILLTFTVGGCSTFSKWENLPLSTEDEVTIYVVKHGWHTGIVIPGDRIDPELSFLGKQFGQSKYFELGWGDKGFYQAKEITSGLTMRAILWPTASVMHVVALPENPETYFPDSKTVAITISTSGLTKLKLAMKKSFKQESGDVVETKTGLYGNSVFFKGKGKYYMTNTCNTWTARMLQTTGAPVHSLLTLTAGSVMRQSRSAVKKYECCSEQVE